MVNDDDYRMKLLMSSILILVHWHGTAKVFFTSSEYIASPFTISIPTKSLITMS